MVRSQRCDSPSADFSETNETHGDPDSIPTSAESDIEGHWAEGYMPLSSDVRLPCDGSDGEESDLSSSPESDPHRATEDLSDNEPDFSSQWLTSHAEAAHQSGLSTTIAQLLPDRTHINLWNASTRDATNSIEVNDDKAEIIRKCMSAFTLPSSAIPPWAKQIPEKVWTEGLKKRLDIPNTNI